MANFEALLEIHDATHESLRRPDLPESAQAELQESLAITYRHIDHYLAQSVLSRTVEY